MRTVTRKSNLPAVFTAFPWVRCQRGMFVDCEEDPETVARYIRIYSGIEDVASLDNHYSLYLAVSIPDGISNSDGTTGRFFAPRHFFWNLYDVEYLLTDSRPAEAVALQEAGFDAKRLLDLATPDTYLAYIRALEDYAGKPKGHYFSKELEDQLASFERRHRGHATLLRKLSGLRVDRPAHPGASAITESMRNRVLQESKYRCIFDGRGRPEVTIHVHHIIPKKLIQRLCLSDRLYTARENLVGCCSGCNIVKSDNLSVADIDFYFGQFRDPGHPNHSVLAYLTNIRALQHKP